MFTSTELRLLVVLVGMLTLPGWAVLSFADNWRQWRGLQRWIVAVGISIAFYPVLFYGLRSVFPFLTLGPYKMSAPLLGCAVIVGWRMRGQRLSSSRPDQTVTAVSEISEALQHYFGFPLHSVPILAACPWLLGLACLGTVVRLLRRSKPVVTSLLCTIALNLVGTAHVLELPVLIVTNLGADLIMPYRPIGLVIGSAAEETSSYAGHIGSSRRFGW